MCRSPERWPSVADVSITLSQLSTSVAYISSNNTILVVKIRRDAPKSAARTQLVERRPYLILLYPHLV